MKFKREKKSVLAGHTEVVYTQEGEQFPPFTVTASPLGISLHGQSSPIDNSKDLQEFARIISEAWIDYLKLKPQIALSPSEH